VRRLLSILGFIRGEKLRKIFRRWGQAGVGGPPYRIDFFRVGGWESFGRLCAQAWGGVGTRGVGVLADGGNDWPDTARFAGPGGGGDHHASRTGEKITQPRIGGQGRKTRPGGPKRAVSKKPVFAGRVQISRAGTALRDGGSPAGHRQIKRVWRPGDKRRNRGDLPGLGPSGGNPERAFLRTSG